ncbi:hypothetical protein C493_16464 [Natronolimnohabitans innermongolicus JCM 12255]|uniref:Uncharacterized protein n=1 Tax=Natronolimnohabitans innermongolicus JCM 12255 TaxID=1227499 RepID=L9WRZ1_9EURY|nr:hypothetical protein C493_16464 [Natronolimnohabitans innermongolicus JCM 12255]
MVDVRSDRAISTVPDVALALLLISASVLLLGLYLTAADTNDVDESQPAQLAETLSGSTISAGYDLEAVTDSDHYEDPEGVDERQRTTYGSATGLLAEAAVANATVEGDPVLLYADSFTERVGASVESQFVGTDRRISVIAGWEPYRNASINGTSTAGGSPPPLEDVTTTTMTVSSGMPAVDSAALASRYAATGEIDALAEPIAAAIVRGYFPPERTQLALERQSLDRSVTVAQYLELADRIDCLDELELEADTDSPLERTDARAGDANEILIEGLTEPVADDLASGPIGAELEAIGDDEDELETFFEEAIAPDSVDVTVYTWNP